MTGIAPSRLRPLDDEKPFHTAGGRQGEIDRPERRCACGTALTWNPDSMCCLCRQKKDYGSRMNHRTKILPEVYPQLLMLKEYKTNKQLGLLFGVTTNYMSELISKIRKASEG
jgi:hypothetical protein